MKPIQSVDRIKDEYSRRILSNLIGRDPLQVFRQTPSKLRKLVHRLPERRLQASPGRGKWSIAFLISHLCDAEWAMGFRIRMAISQPGRPFQAYDQDKWAARLHYDTANWKRKLDLFSTLRSSHVALLENLSPSEWQRYGIHEERGKETVERMVQMLAGHDLNHIRQIEAIRRSIIRPAS